MAGLGQATADLHPHQKTTKAWGLGPGPGAFPTMQGSPTPSSSSLKRDTNSPWVARRRPHPTVPSQMSATWASQA